MADNQQITDILCEVFGISPSEITDDIAYNSFPAWDSLKHLQMVSMLEESLDIEYDMDDIIDMSTVGKIREITSKYLKK